ncbi:MAG: hypothetical protein ABIK97_05900, partial [candidate division WOR-3 bacterium]
MMVFFLILSLFFVQSPVEIKGMEGISYRVGIEEGDLYFQYKIRERWSEPVIIDSGGILEFSIAVTPGDFLHIVWCKEGRVWYKTTLQPITPWFIRQGGVPQWSERVPVSTQDPITEPASNPFVEAEGEWVYVVWRGPNEEGNPNYGEIWQRKGQLRFPGQLPWWFDPINKSKSPQRESNYPTMSTGKVVVYRESLPDNWEVYANLPIPSETVNISRTPTNSFYPHTSLLPAPPYIPFEWQLFSIWTESMLDSFYRVIFNNYFFQPRFPSEPVIDVIPGLPEPSPYCLKRDSFIDFG